ncbi:hypothetical protein ACFOKC_07100 [Halobacterium litoreum]|uniref:Uncharacterized protein n=2 Tax=Halobacterium litoreum TaxID=2039234 RepID=A0ABD5NDR1_9EURY
MGLFDGGSGDERIEALVEGARGDSVTETKLTRTGSKVLGTGTFENHALAAFLREDEQPHYALFNTVYDVEFGDETVDSETGYWQVLVATDQRLLVLAGGEDGDVGEVVPYGVVDPETVVGEKDGLAERELGFVAGGVGFEFEIDGEVPVSEVREAAEYVAERADREDVIEAERSRGLVYDLPNFDVETPVWRPEADEPIAAARGGDVEVAVFDRELDVEGGERTASIPLAHVLEVDVEGSEAEFEFGFADGDGRELEVEHAELDVEFESAAAAERVAEAVESQRNDVPDGVTPDDVLTDGVSAALRERFDALARLAEE